MKKKRYILFGYYSQYPSGGMEDSIQSFDEIDEIRECDDRFNYDYYEIFDTHTFECLRTRFGESLSTLLN